MIAAPADGVAAGGGLRAWATSLYADDRCPGTGCDLDQPARRAAVDGDVRAGRRHVADERVDLLGGQRPAEVLSNTQLEQQLKRQPPDVKAEILRINTDARHIALQVALLIPILAGLLGLFNSFRMMRLPDPAPSSAVEGMALG
jgi:hypothetical protein